MITIIKTATFRDIRILTYNLLFSRSIILESTPLAMKLMLFSDICVVLWVGIEVVFVDSLGFLNDGRLASDRSSLCRKRSGDQDRHI